MSTIIIEEIKVLYDVLWTHDARKINLEYVVILGFNADIILKTANDFMFTTVNTTEHNSSTLQHSIIAV